MGIPQQLMSTPFSEKSIYVAYVILVLDGIDISLAFGSFSFQHSPSIVWSLFTPGPFWSELGLIGMPQFGYVLSTDQLRKKSCRVQSTQDPFLLGERINELREIWKDNPAHPWRSGCLQPVTSTMPKHSGHGVAMGKSLLHKFQVKLVKVLNSSKNFHLELKLHCNYITLW